MASILQILNGIHEMHGNPLEGYKGHINLRTIDIWHEQTSTAADVVYEAGMLGDDPASLSAWIASRAGAVPLDRPPSGGLKLLIVHEKLLAEVGPSPAAQHFLRMAFDKFQIPPTCNLHLPRRQEFTSFPRIGGQASSPPQVYRLDLDWWVLSWSYCPDKKITRGIVQIVATYNTPVAGLFGNVTEGLRGFVAQPCFLGFVAIVVTLTALVPTVSKVLHHTNSMAHLLSGDPNKLSRTKDPSQESRNALTNATNGYSTHANLVALQSLNAFLSQQLAESLTDLTNKSETLRQQADTLDECLRHLDQKIIASKLKMQTAPSIYTMQLAALFNIVAQKDSKVSIEIAAASRALAIQNKKDQQISIAIAKASREIAVESKRDSSSMKTIAAVTMLFLPGTFVASLFATPMFQWSDKAGLQAQSHIWVYWATAIPLTLLTILMWWVWLKFSTGCEQAQLRDAEDFGEDSNPSCIADEASGSDTPVTIEGSSASTATTKKE